MAKKKTPRAKRINSRTKGKVGELELKDEFLKLGYEARRGQQFKGGSDSPDIVVAGLEAFHFESKRVEAGNLYNWLAQAIRDGKGKVPIVCHRRNHKEWVAILRLSDFLMLAQLIGGTF